MDLVAADKLATEVCTGLRVNERAIEVDPQLRQFVINDSLWSGVKNAAIKALAKDAGGHGSEKRTERKTNTETSLHGVTLFNVGKTIAKPGSPGRVGPFLVELATDQEGSGKRYHLIERLPDGKVSVVTCAGTISNPSQAPNAKWYHGAFSPEEASKLLQQNYGFHNKSKLKANFNPKRATCYQ